MLHIGHHVVGVRVPCPPIPGRVVSEGQTGGWDIEGCHHAWDSSRGLRHQ